MRDLYEKIKKGTDRRASLITLKKELKDDAKKKVFLIMTGNRLDEIMKCLVDEDPKVRKNAAAILGELHCQDALDVLMDAYEEEEKLFVKEAYVQALSMIDCSEYLPKLEEHLQELVVYEATEEEKKHIQAEIHALQELILQKKDVKKHTFNGWNRSSEVLLLTLPAFRDVLAEEVIGKKKVLKSGARTIVSDFETVMKIRTIQELLFVIHTQTEKNVLSAEPETLAAQLAESDLMQILTETHKGDAPFYFRIGVSGVMSLEERSAFSKRVSAAIEDAFSRQLINSTSHYEVEIRLLQNREGVYVPLLKLYTLPDHRFDYRRYYVAASMKPTMAAGLMALAKPYLKEHAQILDPFCGVGTLLIERRFLVPARNAYGIDTFGEAIEKARVNSKIAGMQTNYINRDYFDFVHDYKFDEIVTDLPAGKLTKPELDVLYRRFFEKSDEVLASDGRMIFFSREMGLVKKQLRLHPQFRLAQEFCIQEKNGSYLFIVEKRQ
ncbi:HEAT repeat domain-containing protein [uncultured Eubacterium sp.]|uniref:HEAT repeat domain-containing protein n=1 Tax=uncultured Eubacterium sp. TaxID=165185 RepID=UPI0025EF27FB|nr:HEAT repeat domain-containing protein [uncultured Eubacterium sp.]